jgi:hypothetical protein
MREVLMFVTSIFTSLITVVVGHGKFRKRILYAKDSGIIVSIGGPVVPGRMA